VLKTKLNKPNPTSKLILRKEIIEKLEKGKDKKLTLVSAPAGYGKSTIISQWIDQCNLSYSWYSLDKSDNDIETFLQYVIAGIQSKYKNLGVKAMKLLESGSKSSFESVATYIINDISEIEELFYIVFDDYHLIENKKVNNLLSFFLENLPPNIQMVLITRSDPSIPIARLRSQQLLTDIRLADLCFNANNIYEFFKKSLNVNLSIEDARNLESKTEGWIAGLQLTGLSLQGKEDVSDFVKKLKGDNRYIMDYLIEEVLQQQTAETRAFLLNTSILKCFNASLCNEMLNINNSQDIIEQLEKNNMFVVPLDSERKWYRYHHLFEQLLLNRLSSSTNKLNELHGKASNWYEKNEMIEDAIQHSLLIKDYKRSLDLLNKISSLLWANGKHSSLVSYGDLLPDEEIYSNPEFSLYYSWVLIHSGQAPEAVPYLSTAEVEIDKELNNSIDTGEALKLKGRIAVAQAFLQTTMGEFAKIESYSSIAMECLSEDDPLWYSWAWFSTGLKDMGLNNLSEAIKSFKIAIDYGKEAGNIYLVSTIAMQLATCELRMGRYVSSFNNCTELLDYIKNEGYSELTKVDWIFSGLYTTLSMIHYSWGEFEEAEKYIKIGYELSLKESNITFQFYGLFALSFIYQGKNDWEKSLKKLKELEELMNKNTMSPYLMVLYQVWKGYVLIKTEDTQKTSAFFQKNGIGSETEINFLNEHAFIPFVYYLITIGNCTEAKKKLDEINILATRANRLERIIEIQVLYSILYYREGNVEEAIQCIIKSMEIASSEKFVFFFLYYADDIKDLLNKTFKILATRKNNIPKEYIEKLKILIAKQEKTIKNKSNSDLSKRELETLKLLAENLSNQEIAEQLFISIQTVKSHVKNILLKLDVDNRHKAAHKAKELGIV
jgi:LuxR family maltose regulon positive regulatory protein